MMNQPRPPKFSYPSNMPKSYHPQAPFQSKNQSVAQKPQQSLSNNLSQELCKNFQIIENLKAEVQLQKQGKQFLEQQSKYLNKKVQTLKQTTEELQAELQKYKDKYRKLKHKKKNEEVDQFQNSKHRSRQKQSYLRQQQNIREQLQALESRINTPSKPPSSAPKVNYQNLIYQNSTLRKLNSDLQKRLNNLSLEFEEKQLKLQQLAKQINIYHESNNKTQQGIQLLQKQINILVLENRNLKQVFSRNEQLHKHQILQLRQEMRSMSLRSASLMNDAKTKHKLVPDLLQFGYTLHDRSVGGLSGSGSRARYNSTKKIRQH